MHTSGNRQTTQAVPSLGTVAGQHADRVSLYGLCTAWGAAKYCVGPHTVDIKEPQGCRSVTHRPPCATAQACGDKTKPQHTPPFKAQFFFPSLTFLALY